jgi:hypothetical protein
LELAGGDVGGRPMPPLYFHMHSTIKAEPPIAEGQDISCVVLVNFCIFELTMQSFHCDAHQVNIHVTEKSTLIGHLPDVIAKVTGCTKRPMQ